MRKWLQGENTFFISSLAVSAGNYLFNILMAKWLVPDQFADVAFLVTILLAVSFMAMSFQLTATKLISEGKQIEISRLLNLSLVVGAIATSLFFLFATQIALFFQIKNVLALRIYSLVFLGYFVISVNRGLWQGEMRYDRLAISYQAEMWVRLIFSTIAIWWIPIDYVQSVAIVLVVSVLVAMIPVHRLVRFSFFGGLSPKNFLKFLLTTMLYEMSLVMINNTDIIEVKHFFEPFTAGIYSSIALIGRMIYFFSWMLVMTFIPEILKRKREGLSAKNLMYRTLGIVFGFSFLATAISYFFSSQIITIIFSPAYLAYEDLLWQYSIATSLFSCANIFAYYFLSFDDYRPVYISLVFAVFQILGIYFYHSTVYQVVFIQIVLMALLLISMVIYYLLFNGRIKPPSIDESAAYTSS